MLCNDNIDVVSICTPNYLHAPMAIRCLLKNKHIIIEKPMAFDFHDAELISAKSKEVNKHVFCVMQNRFSPTILWLKDLINNLSDDSLRHVFRKMAKEHGLTIGGVRHI